MVTNPTRSDPYRIAVIVPQSGPAGIFGPSCQHCFTLAVEEVNAKGGILGRPVHLITIDGGLEPRRVAEELAALLAEELIDCVIGMHDSDVRSAVLRASAGRVPYIYTPTYEGGDHHEGLFCLGETPEQIVARPIAWLGEHRAVRRWHLVGNDYRWPRKLADIVGDAVARSGGELVGRDLVAFDHVDFEAIIDAITEAEIDGVFVSLVGSSSVAFNRQFLARKFARMPLRFDPLIESNTQMAIGPRAERGLLTASAYLANSDAEPNQCFRAAYDRRFGENAPEVTTLAAGCYDGVHFLAALATKAGAVETSVLTAAAINFAFEGVRGRSRMERCHLMQTIHLIEFQQGKEAALATFSDVPPENNG